MAFDDATRNRLQRFVTKARGILTDEFARQLQQDYGLDPTSGDVAELSTLAHLDDRRLETARLLRDILDHYLAADMTRGVEGRRAVLDRMLREQAFTILNRLAALRMLEARGLLIEVVAKGYQSKGFQLYQQVAKGALGETGDTYRHFLLSVFDTFAADLPGLFDRHAPQGRLFPREPALLAVLDEFDAPDLETLWVEDETIGWIYQYFNSKDERKAMREASQAPRNSRELAVRNQFFTPRYVVEFLVDNTLGRLWFNWTGGETGLRDRCQYLLVKPDEKPEPAQRLRDPRTIKLLDPACGSMHFGLYAFDLFLDIYLEAWIWEETHGPESLDRATGGSGDLQPLTRTYRDQAAFMHDVPRLIIEHNIYGVDIDPRAAQIASLALWLRAQRAWHEADVKAKDRPPIGRGNVLAAVAPPAEVDLRKRFMEELDHRDAELFEQTLFMLKGLPELGVLLQVEKELPALIRKVYGEHGPMFSKEDMAQWQTAEVRLRKALNDYARAARSTYQGRLFAEDALQGLRIIDHFRGDYDIVTMNPPFGEAPESQKAYLKEAYKPYPQNVYALFHLRARQLSREAAYIGAITSRSFVVYRDFEVFRKELIGSKSIRAFADLGWGVLDDAQVETAAYITSGADVSPICGPFIRLIDAPLEKKDQELVRSWRDSSNIFYKKHEEFEKISGWPICYWSSSEFAAAISVADHIYPEHAYVGLGASPHAFFFRAWWEVPSDRLGKRWRRITRGGDFSPFHRSNALVIDWKQDGAGVKQYILQVYPYLNGNYGWKIQDETYYGQPGITWGKRNERFNAQAMPQGHIFTDEGQGLIPTHTDDTMFLLGYLNSSFVSYFLSLTSGLQKHYVYIRPIPIIPQDRAIRTTIADAARQIVAIKHKWDATSEVSPGFNPGLLFGDAQPSSLETLVATAIERHEVDSSLVKRLKDLIDELCCREINLSDDDISEINELRATWPADLLSVDGLLSSVQQSAVGEFARAICSFAMGVCFGRWREDGLTQSCAPGIVDALEEVPSSPPCSVAEIDRRDAPIIVALDDVHDTSLTVLLRHAFQQIFSEHAEQLEEDVVAALGVRSFDEYFRNPQKFFSDHLKVYSKSRRKAPIYWPLSTASGSYTLWLYYPSLTSQTLYTVVNDFVEPKLKQVSRDATTLRDKGSARSREDEKAFETLQALELELIDLRDTLLEIAPTYRPNHDDGVQITAAPLWPLFRHKPWQKVLKDTWAKLEKGDYDWAHLAMAYWPDRVREKCKNDKSLAIAHDLEQLYVEPAPKATKPRGRKRKEVGE